MLSSKELLAAESLPRTKHSGLDVPCLLTDTDSRVRWSMLGVTPQMHWDTMRSGSSSEEDEDDQSV